MSRFMFWLILTELSQLEIVKGRGAYCQKATKFLMDTKKKLRKFMIIIDLLKSMKH